MSYVFNVFTGTLDIDSGANPYYISPVADAASLPFGQPDGTMCVTLDTHNIWVFDFGTNTWIDSGDALPGDIPYSVASGANNQSSPADVTGLLFSNINTSSFVVEMTVDVVATTSANETFELKGINTSGGWSLTSVSYGDVTNVAFSITGGGQVQYISPNYAGFISLTFKFRALTVGA